MLVNEIVVEGDTPDISWRFPVLTFSGEGSNAPRVYIQAALHAGERPGAAVADALCGLLRTAEAENRLLGQIMVVPQANPIGLSQWAFGNLEGRFDFNSRTNFNRDFPLIAAQEREGLLENLDAHPAVDRLKRHLLHMALGADLVLDLHCDDESLNYAYIDAAFWPEARDLAAAMAMDAVLLSDGESSAFEEAVSHAWKAGQQPLTGKLVTTLELRGMRDVSADLALEDAKGIMRFLAARGVIKAGEDTAGDFAGPAVPLDNVEMIRALQAGTVIFHRNLGDRVEAGDLLATLITQPGIAGTSIEVRSPQAGLILTRTSARFVRRRGDLMKIACDAPSAAGRKPGTLEA